MPICWVDQVSVELMTAPSKAMHKSTSGSSSSSSGLRVKITLRFSLSLLLFFATCDFSVTQVTSGRTKYFDPPSQKTACVAY